MFIIHVITVDGKVRTTEVSGYSAETTMIALRREAEQSSLTQSCLVFTGPGPQGRNYLYSQYHKNGVEL